MSEEEQILKEEQRLGLVKDLSGNFKVICTDGELVVPKNIIGMSGFFWELCNDLHLYSDCDEGDTDDVPVQVSLPIFKLIVEFCEHYLNEPLEKIPKPLNDDLSNIVSKWYSTFVDKDQQIIFDLITSSNFLDIKPLLNLSCAKIASMIKGKTPEEIRKTFNIVDDLTNEEKDAIKKENNWITNNE